MKRRKRDELCVELLKDIRDELLDIKNILEHGKIKGQLTVAFKEKLSAACDINQDH